MVPGGRYENIDIVLFRENIEGLYVAFEHYIQVGDDPKAVAISQGVNTEPSAFASFGLLSSTPRGTTARK